MEEEYKYFREKVGINFPCSPNLMDFAAFSHALEN